MTFQMKFGHGFKEWENFLNEWHASRENKRIGSDIILFDEINSTSTYIKENLTKLNSGTVVIARKQISGKGQQQRKWGSEEGGLYLSIKICIDNKHSIQPCWIGSTVAISVCEFLGSLDIPSEIKWPNDILLAGKKVAGILTENIYSKENLVSIIGIGINIANSVKQIVEKFPDLSEHNITLVTTEYP